MDSSMMRTLLVTPYTSSVPVPQTERPPCLLHRDQIGYKFCPPFAFLQYEVAIPLSASDIYVLFVNVWMKFNATSICIGLENPKREIRN